MRNNKGQFVKGDISWWKGKKRLDMIGNTYGRLLKGKPKTEEHKRHISEASRNNPKHHKFAKGNPGGRWIKNHPLWKGEKVGYAALHQWVKRWLGSSDKCVACETEGLMGRQINWANKSQEYKRDLGDWIRLCRNCHIQYDKGLLTIS